MPQVKTSTSSEAPSTMECERRTVEATVLGGDAQIKENSIVSNHSDTPIKEATVSNENSTPDDEVDFNIASSIINDSKAEGCKLIMPSQSDNANESDAEQQICKITKKPKDLSKLHKINASTFICNLCPPTQNQLLIDIYKANLSRPKCEGFKFLELVLARHAITNHPNCKTAITPSGNSFTIDPERATWWAQNEVMPEKSPSVQKFAYKKVTANLPTHAVRHYTLIVIAPLGPIRNCVYKCSCGDAIPRGAESYTYGFLQHVKAKHKKEEPNAQIFAFVPRLETNRCTGVQPASTYTLAGNGNIRWVRVHNKEQVPPARMGSKNTSTEISGEVPAAFFTNKPDNSFTCSLCNRKMENRNRKAADKVATEHIQRWHKLPIIAAFHGTIKLLILQPGSIELKAIEMEHTNSCDELAFLAETYSNATVPQSCINNILILRQKAVNEEARREAETAEEDLVKDTVKQNVVGDEKLLASPIDECTLRVTHNRIECSLCPADNNPFSHLEAKTHHSNADPRFETESPRHVMAKHPKCTKTHLIIYGEKHATFFLDPKGHTWHEEEEQLLNAQHIREQSIQNRDTSKLHEETLKAEEVMITNHIADPTKSYTLPVAVVRCRDARKRNQSFCFLCCRIIQGCKQEDMWKHIDKFHTLPIIVKHPSGKLDLCCRSLSEDKREGVISYIRCKETKTGVSAVMFSTGMDTLKPMKHDKSTSGASTFTTASEEIQKGNSGRTSTHKMSILRDSKVNKKGEPGNDDASRNSVYESDSSDSSSNEDNGSNEGAESRTDDLS